LVTSIPLRDLIGLLDGTPTGGQELSFFSIMSMLGSRPV
jgi:hypothetical protein